jgi:hypothetical protein
MNPFPLKPCTNDHTLATKIPPPQIIPSKQLARFLSNLKPVTPIPRQLSSDRDFPYDFS